MDQPVLRILKEALNVQSIEASHDPIPCRTDRHIRRRVSAALSDFLRDPISDTAIGGECSHATQSRRQMAMHMGAGADPDDTNLVFVATYTDAPSAPPTCAIVAPMSTPETFGELSDKPSKTSR
jgi:hypothetical protein